MPHAKKRSRAKRQPIEAALRAALLQRDAVIPDTPEEVAAFDARHRDDPLPPIQPPRPPSLRFSWEIADATPAGGEVVAFPSAAAGPLAYAARMGGAVSAATRAKLGRLVREMKKDGERPRG